MYVCKYINKRSDQATFSVRYAHKEVENYLKGGTSVHLKSMEIIKVSCTRPTSYLRGTFREWATSILLDGKYITDSGKSTENDVHCVF